MFILASSHLFGEFLQRHREQLHVDGGQDQPENFSALGTNETVEIGPLVASVEAGDGSLAHRSPHPPHHRLEAHSRLVLGPQFYLRLRMGFLQLLQLQRKTFLKASRSEAEAPSALEGLGTWGL